MKKHIVLSFLCIALMTFLMSFTTHKKSSNTFSPHKMRLVKKNTTKGLSCSSVVSNLSQTGSYTFTWTASPGYDHFNYGGYYQAGGGFSGSTATCTVTIPATAGGGRIGVTPVCSDGSLGTPQDILFH